MEIEGLNIEGFFLRLRYISLESQFGIGNLNPVVERGNYLSKLDLVLLNCKNCKGVAEVL